MGLFHFVSPYKPYSKMPVGSCPPHGHASVAVPPQCSGLLSTSSCLLLAVVGYGVWYLVDLTYMSLVIGEIRHLCISLFSISLFYLGNCLVCFPVFVVVGLFVFVLVVRVFCPVLLVHNICQMYMWWVFAPSPSKSRWFSGSAYG